MSALHVAARLQYDSAEAGGRAVRGPAADPRFLLFRSGDFSVDLYLQNGGGGIRLVHGLVAVAGGSDRQRVEAQLGSQSVVVDDHGEFAFTLLDEWPDAVLIRAPGVAMTCVVPPERSGRSAR